MKKFTCECGQPLFFENTRCLKCNRILAYEYVKDEILSLTELRDGIYSSETGERVKLCRNYQQYNICNVCIPINQENDWCIACQLNQTIPNLEQEANKIKWAKLEKAKRRLVRTLHSLGLPIVSRHFDEKGLAFAFLEDKNQNPSVTQEFVSTGHHNGLITINLAEADDALRESAKEQLGEQYRTLLGHLRHESGHYYFDRYIKNSEWINLFRETFGDERKDYQNSLDAYYASKPYKNWEQNYISEYAIMHPLEDWAECWAHYLHMIDTLETAYSFNAIEYSFSNLDIDERLAYWSDFTVVLNELNRSMGLSDAYPFVLSSTVIKKLSFVHQMIDPKFGPIQREVTD